MVDLLGKTLGSSMHRSIGQSLECPLCDQQFSTPIRRQQHLTFHRARTLMCYNCKNAEVQFPCYSAMIQHMMTGCGEINSSELDYHVACWYQWNRVMIPEIRKKIRMRQRIGPPVTYRYIAKIDKFSCTSCDKVFKLEKGALMHTTSNIHNPNIYRCPACKAEFPSLGALLLHAESLKCTLSVRMDSTLGKLLHFIHLKLHPQSVEAVIKEDLGVLVSQVTTPKRQVPDGVVSQVPGSNPPAEALELIKLVDIDEETKEGVKEETMEDFKEGIENQIKAEDKQDITVVKVSQDTEASTDMQSMDATEKATNGEASRGAVEMGVATEKEVVEKETTPAEVTEQDTTDEKEVYSAKNTSYRGPQMWWKF